VFLLLADESPNLIELQQVTFQTAHFAIEKRGATLPYADA
jgi:hypothetical protein